MTAVGLAAGNQLVCGYATTAGRTYVVQSSTNLVGWQNLTNNVAVGALLIFTNLISPAVPSRFFRVLELP